MTGKLYGLIGLLVWLTANVIPSAYSTRKDISVTPSVALPRAATGAPMRYSQTLRYNIYTFTIEAPDSGVVRELTVKAHRGQLLLTNFRVRIEGAVVGAEVADLDKNRYPELYAENRRFPHAPRIAGGCGCRDQGITRSTRK